MGHDFDGSGVLSLVWAAWVYWWVYKWLELMGQTEARNEDGGRDRLKPADGDALPPASQGPGQARIAETLHAVVAEILRREGSATPESFLACAAAAYETVVAAFDAGDRETLGRMVSPDVYDAFMDAIAARQAGGETARTVFARIDPPQILDAAIDRTHMRVSIRFIGEAFRLPQDAAGAVAGGASRYRSVDVWTFERRLFPNRSLWHVVATRGDA